MTNPQPDDDFVSCSNCTATLQGAYCHQCGQKEIKARLSVGGILRGLPQKIFNWERGIWPTFIAMWTRPGQVATDFVDGKRRTYVNPISYFLIGSSAQLLISLWLSAPLIRQELGKQVSAAKEDPRQRENFAKLEELMGQEAEIAIADLYIAVIGQAYTYLAFLAFCFPLGLMLWIFHRFRGTRFNFAEVMVFAIYLVGHCLIFTAFTTPIFARISTTLQLITAQGFYLGYALWAHKYFFSAGFGSRVLTLMAMIIAMTCFFVSIFGVFLVTLIVMAMWNRLTGL